MKLSTALSLSVMCLCCCMFAAITAALERNTSRQEERQAHVVTEYLQHSMANDVEDTYLTIEREVRRSAMEAEKLGGKEDYAEVYDILSEMTACDPMVKGGCVAYVPDAGDRGWMYYVSALGDSIVAKHIDVDKYRYTGMPWFNDCVESGQPVWSAPYFDKGAGDCLMITYSIPLKSDSGVVFGVVTADVAMSSISDELVRLRPYPSSVSFLTYNGKIIGDSLPNIPDADDKLECVAPINPPGLMLHTVTDRHDTLPKGLQRLKLEILAVLAVGFLLMALVIHLLIRYLTMPLKRLAVAANEIGEGNFNAAIPVDRRFTDLNKLREAMRHMEKSIGEYVVKIADEARQRESIESEIRFAAGIQRSMLPERIAGGKVSAGSTAIGLDALLEPAKEVSGDLYFWLAAGNRLYMCVADVSGKGIPASLLMVSVRERLQNAAMNGRNPAQILREINDAICANNPQNMFVTMQVAMFDSETLSLTISNAGHNPPAWLTDKEWSIMHLPAGLPVGIMTGMDYVETVLDFMPGNALFMYTDGLTEAENADGEMFGEERVTRYLDAMPQGDVIDILEKMKQGIEEYDGNKSSGHGDDITMLLCRNDGDTRRLSLPRDKKAFEILGKWTESIRDRWKLSEGMTYNLNLIIEEWAANVISYDNSSDKDMEVAACRDGEGVALTLAYEGREFNPLESSQAVDIDADVESRPVGGLGLWIIGNLASQMNHEFKDSINTTMITLKNL